MKQKISSDQILGVARSWVGTKFQMFSSLKKNEKSSGGCDCLGLITGVFEELELKEFGRFFQDYQKNKTPHMNLINFSENLLKKEIFLNKKNQLNEGNIVCFEIEKSFYHLAFIGSLEGQNEKNLTIIHSFSKIGFVVENFLDEFWIKKIRFVFSINN